MSKMFNVRYFILLLSYPSVGGTSVDELSFEGAAKINSMVVTPARLSQHKRDVPAGVTVISASTIRELGLSHLADVMRLVPGMRVIQASGWDYRINFHGTNALIPRRMLLLINGMAVHRYGLAEIDWSLLPLDLEDIERIEVTRSPSSPSYGSNAFQQVVNIITKYPRDVESVYLHSERGSNGLYRDYGRISGRMLSTDFLISLSQQGDNGFDYVQFDRKKRSIPGAIDDHDVDRVLFRSNTEMEQSTLELNIGGVRSRVEDEEVDSNQLAPPNRRQEDRHFQAIYKRSIGDRHGFRLQVSFKNDKFYEAWRACNVTAAFVGELRDLSEVNSELAWKLIRGQSPVGSTLEEIRLVEAAASRFQELGLELSRPICGHGNQDSETWKRAFELDDTFAVTEDLQVNTGIGYQDNDIHSETFTGGGAGSHHKYFFSNAEYLAGKSLTVNAGFMFESVSTVRETAFAPRLGLNYHFDKGASVRFVYSTGKRMPNILETNMNWSYLVRDWDHEFDGRTQGKFFLTTRSPEGLEPESIEAYEIGIHSSVFSNRLEYDARLFDEDLTRLISEKGEFFDYSLSNSNSVQMTGFEGEISFRLTSNFEVGGGYSYIDSKSTNIFEKTLYSRHQGFASIIYRMGSSSIALAGYSQSPVVAESYDRIDLSFTKSFSFGNQRGMQFQVTGSHLGFDKVAYQWRTDNTARHSYYGDNMLKARVMLYY